MSARILLVPLACAVLLAGCAAPSPSPEQRAALEQPARSLEARGAWREAALAWQQAADAAPGELGADYRLNAADALLEAGDGAAAQAVVAKLPQGLAQRPASRRALVLADAALLEGDAAAALAHAGPGLASDDPALITRYRRIRADALELTGDLLGAARERALRDPLLRSPEARYRNRLELWELLRRVPDERLAAQPAAAPGVEGGWIELARIAREHGLDLAGLEAALEQWNVRHPGHPAGEQIVPQLVETVREESRPPARVALLLPGSGPFARAAAAVRDGFLAAWFADAPNPERPEIVIRDSAAGDIGLIYTETVAAGAQLVVGPLSKERVNELLLGIEPEVTTLTLNYPSAGAEALAAPLAAPAPGPGAPAPDAGAVDASAPPAAPESGAASATPPAARDLRRVFQFALAPEDEARRAAEHAFGRGARQAAVLAPQGEWGTRVGAAFAARWRALGGILAEELRFPDEATGLSAAVEQLLNIDDSEARARALRAALVRDIQHEPQPRSDLDVIFMAAFPEAARQLRPLLLFHRAGDVPVVATSHVYAGRPDPASDVDLDGVVFGDMPWLLDPRAYTLPQQVGRIWPAANGSNGRLYAFGADAYMLAVRLRELRADAGTRELAGVTGMLSLGPERRLRRALLWAQMRDGLPVLLDGAADAAPPRPWGGPPR